VETRGTERATATTHDHGHDVIGCRGDTRAAGQAEGAGLPHHRAPPVAVLRAVRGVVSRTLAPGAPAPRG